MSVWLEGGPAESFAPSLSMGELWAAPAGAELCSQALHSLEEQPVPWPAAAAAAAVLLLVSQQKGADEIWSPAQLQTLGRRMVSKKAVSVTALMFFSTGEWSLNKVSWAIEVE